MFLTGDIRPLTQRVVTAVTELYARVMFPAALGEWELIVSEAFAAKLVEESPAIFRIPPRRMQEEHRLEDIRSGYMLLTLADCPRFKMVVDERSGAEDYRMEKAGTLLGEVRTAHQATKQVIDTVVQGRPVRKAMLGAFKAELATDDELASVEAALAAQQQKKTHGPSKR